MKEIKQSTYKGTRILIGNYKRRLISQSIDYCLFPEGFNEISIPIIQSASMFENKVGKENNNMMYNFKDTGNRDLCLAPEYTAVIQNLSKTIFKQDKDVKLFYVQECFRGEKPQKGRYRQFTQLGVEIINPTIDYTEYLIGIAETIISFRIKDYYTNKNVVRGLDYYNKGKGFEIVCDGLGNSKQICGGGSYDGGIGFAIGIDRMFIF